MVGEGGPSAWEAWWGRVAHQQEEHAGGGWPISLRSMLGEGDLSSWKIMVSWGSISTEDHGDLSAWRKEHGGGRTVIISVSYFVCTALYLPVKSVFLVQGLTSLLYTNYPLRSKSHSIRPPCFKVWILRGKIQPPLPVHLHSSGSISYSR